MKYAIVLILLCLVASPSAATMFLIEEGHCHYNFDYIASQWQASFRHETDGDWPLDNIINHARTNNWPSGSRFIRPAGGVWDFTGVAAGDPLYIFPQASSGSILWPSFSSDQTPISAFAAYSESDPRVSSASTRWVSYHLVQVRYWGEGYGMVSLWNSTGGDPVVWMTMTNGIGPDDRFLLELGGHVHVNWGFSDIGWYEIDARASAYITYPTVHTTSPPARIYFGIGVTGAPPAELTMTLQDDQPWLQISTPGPGTNHLMTTESLTSGVWIPISSTNDSWWAVMLTNTSPRAFYRLAQ